MSENALVFHDDAAPIDTLIVHAINNPVSLDARDVDVVDAARATEGEVWSPQLLPYQSWSARGGADGGAEGADAPQGVDGDLLVVGALGMGISDEERERLLAQAAQQDGVGGAAAVRVPLRERMDAGLRGAIGVRRDADGYVLTAVDLRRYAEALGMDEGLVVKLPAFVDGVPVVRIAAEAFARRYVQGVGVRVLVVPDTVERVAAHAFLALSATRIHLGRGVQMLGEQPCDLAGVSPRLARREYSVDSRNERYQAHDGNLFSDDGTHLLFFASPYPEQVELPEGLKRIGSAAFAAGCAAPSVVRCSAKLTHVESRAWDDAVWLCPADAPAYKALGKRGVRLAGANAVEQDGCWYDFDNEGAVLVAGPPAPASVSRKFAAAAAIRAVALRGQGDGAEVPSPGEIASQAATAAAQPMSAAGADDMLVLPREVQGCPLVRIGVRALPHAPATLVLPDTVRVVERDNACKGTVRLVLPEGLREIGAHSFCSRILEGPVLVPASVRSIGEGCFEYAVVRLEHTGTIVHVSADQLLSCFLVEPARGVPFDFARYDELLRSGKNLPDRLGAVLHRLASPVELTDQVREALVGYLREREREAQERVAREGDRQMVEALVHAGFINERTFDAQIERLRACNRTDCVLYLMEEHRARGAAQSGSSGGAAASARDRFAL